MLQTYSRKKNRAIPCWGYNFYHFNRK